MAYPKDPIRQEAEQDALASELLAKTMPGLAEQIAAVEYYVTVPLNEMPYTHWAALRAAAVTLKRIKREIEGVR